MLFQQRQEFLLKGHFAVMGGLTLDVGDGLVQQRHAHAESAIFLLPGKPALFGKSFVNPF